MLPCRAWWLQWWGQRFSTWQKYTEQLSTRLRTLSRFEDAERSLARSSAECYWTGKSYSNLENLYRVWSSLVDQLMELDFGLNSTNTDTKVHLGGSFEKSKLFSEFREIYRTFELLENHSSFSSYNTSHMHAELFCLIWVGDTNVT